MNVWLLWFFVSFTITFVIFAYFEIRGLLRNPPNATLSQTVWDFQARYPIFGVILGFILGALLGGLAIHFFGWIPSCIPTNLG